MGFDLNLEIKAKIHWNDIIAYSRNYQKMQVYFNSQRWPEIKRKYLEPISNETFLKTIQIRLDNQGLLWIMDYQIASPELNTDDLRDYLLLLWLEMIDDGTIDIDYCPMVFDDSVVIEDNMVVLPLYYDSSYKGRVELNVDYRKIARVICDLEAKFKRVQVITKLGMS